MSKKSRRKPAGKRSPRQSEDKVPVVKAGPHDARSPLPDVIGTVPPALGRMPARKVSPGAGQKINSRPKNPRTAGIKTEPRESVVTSLQVDEAQPLGRLSAMLADAEPQGLAASYSFDAPTSEDSYSVSIRFTGARVGVPGKSEARDHFEQIERLDGLTAGNGRVTVTTRVHGINKGEWRVVAAPIAHAGTVSVARRLPQRVLTTTRTQFWLLAQGPGVRLVAWPALVGLGAVVAGALQLLLAARAGMDVTTVLVVSLIGCVLGFVGGKAWYLVLHRKHPRDFLASGACIQGFLVAALGAVALAGVMLRLPVGVLLDATAPGIFIGMAIGRPGCFLTGCCVGRPTRSRWGLWSSDRRLALSRVPVQLVEAATALAIGAVTLTLVLTVQPPISGAMFVGALAAYTFCRQLLFPFRAESHTSTGRAVTMAICGLVLVAALAASVFAASWGQESATDAITRIDFSGRTDDDGARTLTKNGTESDRHA